MSGLAPLRFDFQTPVRRGLARLGSGKLHFGRFGQLGWELLWPEKTITRDSSGFRGAAKALLLKTITRDSCSRSARQALTPGGAAMRTQT